MDFCYPHSVKLSREVRLTALSRACLLCTLKALYSDQYLKASTSALSRTTSLAAN